MTQETERTELSVHAERALLVTVMLPASMADPADPVGELRSLARTAGAVVVDEMLVRRRTINAGLYVGTGKAQEIAQRTQQNRADVVIFDNDLSPAQVRELEEITHCKVLDRSELILGIFAAHARTAESRLQVELAQLEYTYPRLRHMWTHLERLAGGAVTAAAAVGGIGTRGPGEKQLETDRRLVQKRVAVLKRRIAEIDQRKVRQVAGRKRAYCVCLVGYTNAGKSTLMNLLTGTGAYVADKLFSTLDTKTCRWNLGDGQSVLLSDTVGFVRNLPHHLVASFRATLEEAIHADLLIHVADASHPRVEHQIAAVEGVLAELKGHRATDTRGGDPNCEPSRQLLALNKIDRVNDPTVGAVLARRYPRAVFISAATGQGASELAAKVAATCGGAIVPVVLRANCANGRLMQFIARYAHIRAERFSDSQAVIKAELPANRLAELRVFGQDVQIAPDPACSR